MARVYAGDVLGLIKPSAGQTVELKVVVLDAGGSPLTGQAYNAAGMAVQIAKPGAAYVTWATIVGNAWATGNWQEVGNGVYNIILSGDVAGEAALLDTPGDVAVYIKNTASRGDNFLYRCVSADTLRVGTGVGQLATTSGKVDLVDAPNATAVTALVAAVWSALTSTMTGAGSIGKKIADWAILTAQGARDAMKLAPSSGTAATGSVDALLALTALEAGGNIATILGRLPAGTVASSAEVVAIQNNTRCVRVVPSVIERPDSGALPLRIELMLYDEIGNMETPDAAPTVAVVNQEGTSRDDHLGSTTMTLVSTGRYRAIYTAQTADAIEELVFSFSVVEGGATRAYGNVAQVVDTTAVDFTAADRLLLQKVSGLIETVTGGDRFTAHSLEAAPVTSAEDVAARVTDDHGVGSYVSTLGGSGAWPVTLTVVTDAGDPVQNATVAIHVPEIGMLYTDALGQTHWALNDSGAGHYTAYVGSSSCYEVASSYEFSVSATGVVTGGTFVVTEIDLPTPAAGTYLLRATGRDEHEVAYGHEAMTVRVVSLTMSGRADATTGGMREVRGTVTHTDSVGAWSMDIPQDAFVAGASLTLEFGWQDAAGDPVTEQQRASLVAPETGNTVLWAALSPRIIT